MNGIIRIKTTRTNINFNGTYQDFSYYLEQIKKLGGINLNHIKDKYVFYPIHTIENITFEVVKNDE